LGLFGGPADNILLSEAVPKLQLLEDKRSLSSYLEFRGKTGFSTGFSKSLFKTNRVLDKLEFLLFF
jgi:hypothetical protein